MSSENDAGISNEEMILALQRETFDFFIDEGDPDTGLISDSTMPDSPASIASTGMGISVYIVGVERGLISRDEALNRTLRILRFFHQSHQGNDADATGYQGFYYHFIDKKTGKRRWECELSTIDTALLLVGMLTASEYFSREHDGENEVRKLVQELVGRVNWPWALNGQKTLTHGWKPESGFLEGRWNKGYSEAHILYVLAMGSPNFPIEADGYLEWTNSFEVKEFYQNRYIYAGPLFIHQMSHIWLCFEGIRDDFTRKLGFDYFENSKRATLAQRAYAIANPKGFKHYGEFGWGITASDGPGPAECKVDGVDRKFFNYVARGAPDDIDDGTISPWAVVTSLPFTPEIVLATIHHAIEEFHLRQEKRIKGFDASYNRTFPIKSPGHAGWASPWRYGLNQGPIILMIENYLTGKIWELLKENTVLKTGLKKAGFRSSERL